MTGRYIHGTGPQRAIVLHGWLGDWRVFEPMLPALDPNQFSLAFMDARGYGASMDSSGPFDMRTLAEDAKNTADQLGWESFAVIGHSMGAKAALRLAIDYADRVTRILALTPVWASPAPLDAQALALFRGAATDLELRAAILDNTTGGRLTKAWSHAQAATSLKVSTSEAFAAYFESWAFDDFSAEARNVRHETLVVAGAHDGGVTEAGVRATWLKELANARLQVLPEAGHYPMLETPLLLAAVVERFLTEGVIAKAFLLSAGPEHQHL
jgi:pimeloyl-ACP methyl ester carboxylesterase